MSQVKSFTIGNVTYNAAMASAIQQDELLSLLTASVMQRGLQAALSDTNMGEYILVPMFMAMPQEIKRQVAGKLLHKTVVNGGKDIITVENFSGKMVEYNKLLSQLLQWNLSDFFIWLESALKDARPPHQNDPVL
jgi:hypothetical protein